MSAPRRAFTPPPRFDEFQILQPLGQGAMGQVYLARDVTLLREVAIKFLATRDLDDAARERFQVEAQALARLTHPNVVTLYRAGEVARRPYLVSEYVRGQSLDRLQMPLSRERVLSIARQLCRGIALAHGQGVLHRDIKPANAVQAEDGMVKLLDFGLAKLLDPQPDPGASSDDGSTASLADPKEPAAEAGGAALTGDGALLGTPRYMAPEIWRRQRATPASDVYSLGALLYELCSGAPPFHDVPREDLGQVVQERDASPLRRRAPRVDRRLAALVDRCLRRDPAARPTARGLLQALDAIDGRRWPWPGKRAARWIGGLLACGIIAGGLTWLAWPRHLRDMVYIEGGTFGMGSASIEVGAAVAFCLTLPGERCPRTDFSIEEPRREVTVSPYYIDATEVTNRSYAAWLNAMPDVQIENPWVSQGGDRLIYLYPSIGKGFGVVHEGGRFLVRTGTEEMPVTQVTWYGARRYCQALGKDLPSEAQWERAARGIERRTFAWGEEQPRCKEVVSARAQGMGCAALGLPPEPWPVRQAKQDWTKEGVHDLAGNVAEWVLDTFAAPYPACPPPCLDPIVRPEGERKRVVRGGHWNDAVSVRGAARAAWPPGAKLDNVGFRCAAPVHDADKVREAPR